MKKLSRKMGRIKLLLQSASRKTLDNIMHLVSSEPVTVTEMYVNRISSDKYFIRLRLRCSDKDMNSVGEKFNKICSAAKKTKKEEKK